MGFHTYDLDRADRLEQAERRYRYLSVEELLWALDPDGDERVTDLGSGTGFFTDAVAPHVGEVIAIDVQSGMHAYYREKGVPVEVALVTGTVDHLPLATGSVDTAFSTMTYHEFASDAALSDLHRVLRSDGRVVTVDWSATGSGEAGPPLTERFTPQDAVDAFTGHGFECEFLAERPETFLLVTTPA